MDSDSIPIAISSPSYKKLLGMLCAILLMAADAPIILSSVLVSRVPLIETNEDYIDAVTRNTSIPLHDEMAVFAFVLNSLPHQVKVYPTENYYYFRFTHNGVRYAGDIRLSAEDLDQGKVHFGYYEELSGWKTDDGNISVSLILDETRNVKVEMIEQLVYRITYGKKSVVFELNDLSEVKPPKKALGPEEKYIGPIFDESAIRFFFIYNPKLKVFYYILDETVRVPDEFMTAKFTDRILIGKRTGFAFYRDHKLDRKILIGVHESNTKANNYLDGPFDQIPENFIQGNAFRDMIVDADPSVKGKINRFWRYYDGSGRYLVSPYRLYRRESDFRIIHLCATGNRVIKSLYYACFVFDKSDSYDRNAQPLAWQKLYSQRHN